ncbi:MAG: hypothetical protein IAE87_16520 [Rhodobacteraceae bacterium]|jgi:hypothetical protein|nr:hypothetical protein [Paracoccaceae bacterium]
MAETLEPILPQVPVEEIAVHIGRAGLCMGDEARAAVLPDGRVGVFARVRRPFLGLFPMRREGYLGHFGPMASQILAPALTEGVPLRLRIVVLTPEHLATAGPPEIFVSVWGVSRQMAPYLADPGLYVSAPAEPDNTPGASTVRLDPAYGS